MKKLSTQAPLVREAEERELSALQKDWKEYFGAKLSKFDVESPADLSDEDKKEFFNDLKKDWERGKGATAAGKKDMESQGVKENEEVNEASGFKVGDKVALLSKSDKKKFDAGVVTKVQSDGNVVVNKTQHFNHEIVMDPDFLVKENEEVNANLSDEEYVKALCIKRLSNFFNVSPSSLRKFHFDGDDSMKDIAKALDAVSVEGAEAYYNAAIQMSKKDLGLEESINDSKKESTIDYSVYEEFLELDENLSLSSLGVEDDILYVLINGNKYGYRAPTGKKIEDIAKSFAGLAKHSAGRALAWLKKNTELVFGSKKVKESVNEGAGVLLNEYK